MEAQEIVVTNKSQLLVALECARECDFPTIITLAKSRTTFYIERLSGKYDNNWIEKLKGRLRKTEASAIY